MNGYTASRHHPHGCAAGWLKTLRDADQQKIGKPSAPIVRNIKNQLIRAAREKGDSATAKQLMDAQRVKMDARRDDQVAAIRGLLTADQTPSFDANVAEMKKRETEGRGRGGPGGRGPRPPQS